MEAGSIPATTPYAILLCNPLLMGYTARIRTQFSGPIKFPNLSQSFTVIAFFGFLKSSILGRKWGYGGGEIFLRISLYISILESFYKNSPNLSRSPFLFSDLVTL